MAAPVVAPHPLLAFTLSQAQTALQIGGSLVSLLMLLGIGAIFIPKKMLQRRALLAENAVAQLAAGVEALTSQVAGLRSEVTQMRKTQVVSTRYIAQLVLFIRSRRPVGEMPALPDEISDDVLAEIRAHELAQDAAVQGAGGLVAP
jgi:hypothetical protein